MRPKALRLGILGGTFNPVHHGHLVLASNAVEVLDLDRLILIPCLLPPHKTCAALAPANHRRAMLESAIEGSLVLEVSGVELERGGHSYSIDTVRHLQTAYPGAELFFIIGTDSLPELHLWKDIHDLLELCTFVPFGRPTFDAEAMTEDDLKLGAWGSRLLGRVQPGCAMEISSSDIRHRVAEGMSIRYLVPGGVEMYIVEHRLYRS
jgi:nicotinate-nucleotide adenylyltransferase